jgi:hypothetical protein
MGRSEKGGLFLYQRPGSRPLPNISMKDESPEPLPGAGGVNLSSQQPLSSEPFQRKLRHREDPCPKSPLVAP